MSISVDANYLVKQILADNDISCEVKILECWNAGTMEYWVIKGCCLNFNSFLIRYTHYSTIPIFQYSCREKE